MTQHVADNCTFKMYIRFEWPKKWGKFIKEYTRWGFTVTKNSDNKPWVYICPKGLFGGLIFKGAYLSRGLSLERILHFNKYLKTLKQQPKTANSNNPWAST